MYRGRVRYERIKEKRMEEKMMYEVGGIDGNIKYKT
jgi:hypothetical protein